MSLHHPRAPLFEERLSIQRAHEAAATEGYGYTLGNYSRVPLMRAETRAKEYLPKRIMNDVTLRGIEVFIADSIHALLAQSADRPVVALDVGAGLRLSWLRLAKAFLPEVQAGVLALAGTNLRDKERFLRRNPLVASGYASLQAEVGAYVPSIQTTFSGIPDQSIPLVDGSSLPLVGNTQLVHEHLSLTHWTQIPEVDIAGVGDILAPNGIFMARESAHRREPVPHSVMTPLTAKWFGVKIAHELLVEEHGLTMVDTIQMQTGEQLPLDYLFFRGPDAPRVPVTLGQETSYI